MTLTVSQKRERFAELHKAPGCFVMPNPFDVGSAKYPRLARFPGARVNERGDGLRRRASRMAASIGPMR